MGRGKLVFKGEKKAKKKKKSAKHKSGDLSQSSESPCAGGDDAVSGTNTSDGGTAAAPPLFQESQRDAFGNSDHQTKEVADETPIQGIKVKNGKGSITTSSTVVSGHGTAFKTELRAGDAILVRNQKGLEEMRVVTMVLSQVSISMSSAFSSNLKTPTAFSYINKPRDVKRERAALAQEARQEKEEVEQRAMGTYGNKEEVVYREKTEHGGYRIRREKATTEMSRSDLLAARAKKKSDRYC